MKKFNFNIDIEENSPLSKSQNDIISQKQSYEDNEIFVDLGLPSGTLWARMNLGAFKSQYATSWYGKYYAWGEVKSRNRFIQASYKEKEENQYIIFENDAAYQESNGLMKIASRVNYKELTDALEKSQQILQLQYVHNYNDINNLNGALFISNINGNSLFFPFSGYVNNYSYCCLGTSGSMWTNESMNYYQAYYWLVKDKMKYGSFSYYDNKYKGLTIRGVKVNK